VKEKSRLSLWFPIVLFVAAVMLASIVSVIIASAQIDGEITGDTISEALRRPHMLLTALLIQNGFVMLFLYLFVVKKKALSWEEMGLIKPRFKHVLFGLGYGLLAMLVVIVVSMGLQSEGDTSILPEIDSAADFAMIAIGVAIVAPIFEEIFFRGYCFNGLKKRFGNKEGIGYRLLPFVYSSVFFGLIHFSVASIAIIASAFVLAIALDRTKSLVTPIVAHMLNNSFALLSVYVLSG